MLFRSERDQALSSIAAQWATKDVNGALAWAQGLPESSAKRNAVRTVLGELANQDPQAAAQFALNLTGAGRQEAISSVAGMWSQTDFNAALNWVRNLTDPRARPGLAGARPGMDPARPAGRDRLRQQPPVRAVEDQPHLEHLVRVGQHGLQGRAGMGAGAACRAIPEQRLAKCGAANDLSRPGRQIGRAHV